MPRGDKTGPMGLGEMTGRGLGNCKAESLPKHGIGYGMGYGCRQGFNGVNGFIRHCRGFGRYVSSEKAVIKSHNELLLEEKNRLNQRLKDINKKLGVS